ncbi:zinc ABC transporter substrate-binding protein [Primorskyibacter sp. S187A]|uniref:zinc ABC transporter substrate-binding protein n=1 Tax=Primorskyibacter sp. S187A TaxID=3415130 RepID=UPI003C7E7769
MRLPLFASLIATGQIVTGQIAYAEPPRVVADILPLHSMAAAVTKGVSTPEFLLPPGADPHGYALRPSEARALSNADVVLWVGPVLTPWLEQPLDNLATNAARLTAQEMAGIELLPMRALEDFGTGDGHDHDAHDHAKHDEHDHDDHDHAKHDEHDHDDHDHAKHEEHDHDDHDHAKHEEHDHDEHDHAKHDAHHGHNHGPEDAHLWLDPANAVIIATALADHLAKIDPDNAATYQSNAEAFAATLATKSEMLRDAAEPLRDVAFLVDHDSYRYIEDAFGLTPAGTLSLATGAPASPSHLQELTVVLAETSITCLFLDPASNTQRADTFLPATLTRVSLDPLGSTLTPGPELYGDLLTSVAEAYAGCAS